MTQKPKPQPWYTAPNLPSWSPKHGRNRQSPAPSHSNPPDRADPPIDPLRTIPFTPIPGAVTYISHLALTNPSPPAIPYAGIRTGELIGHRMWLVLANHTLCSLAHHFIWSPGATITGDVDARVGGPLWYPIFGGTYAYKDPILVHRELHDILKDSQPFPLAAQLSTQYLIIHGIAWGTVKLWGEVVEHERGYRGQFAKLTSIDGCVGTPDLITLRRKYHV